MRWEQEAASAINTKFETWHFTNMLLFHPHSFIYSLSRYLLSAHHMAVSSWGHRNEQGLQCYCPHRAYILAEGIC